MSAEPVPHSICLVANPFAAAGRLGRRLPWIQEEARRRFKDVELLVSRRKGDLATLAAQGAASGHTLVAAVGGDGTISEVADGLHAAGASAALGVLPVGTGSDFAKTIQVPRDPLAALDFLAATPPKPTDIGLCRHTGPAGEPLTRRFINITDFGLGGEVVARANRSPKWLGSFFTFYINTVLTLALYRPKRVRLTFDGQTVEKGITAVIVANGQYFGGGMRSAPMAKLDDGLFDLIVLDAMPPLKIVRNLSKLYGATELLQNPAVQAYRVTHLQADSEDETLLDLDGEQPGRLPATFEIVPGGLRVVRA
ncbi:MAG: diacylglycerol kinase family lipid kinase [Nitrospirae bacterium]|nr:diacylglycerol kinase family lipid kinase [Nitrospirota bacterium]